MGNFLTITRRHVEMVRRPVDELGLLTWVLGKTVFIWRKGRFCFVVVAGMHRLVRSR